MLTEKDHLKFRLGARPLTDLRGALYASVFSPFIELSSRSRRRFDHLLSRFGG
jgi:hypothetical protein